MLSDAMRVTFAVVALTLVSCGEAPKAARPAASIVVLTFDAMRADGLGVYGNPRNTSPTLDAFAAESWLFEQAYSAAPITSASFAAMFGGRYPRKTNAWRVESETTIAEIFSSLGFRTAGFVGNRWLQRSRGFARGFGRWEVRNGADEKTLARALAWMKQHRGEPFFLWIHLLDPHIPWVRHPEASHLYDADYRGEFVQMVPPLSVITDPQALARAKDLYEGEIFHADRLFRRFWRALRRLGLDERVAVVVGADHGEELMEHGWLQHGHLTNENLHVPLLIRPPGGMPGRRISPPVGMVDLLPTLLELAGREVPHVAPERSLLRVDGNPRPLFAVAERHSVAARLGALKLIITCDEEPRYQLFDLAVDPRERNDLTATRADAVRDLERAAWHAMGAQDCADYAAPTSSKHRDDALDPETRRQLEALGYVDGDTH